MTPQERAEAKRELREQQKAQAKAIREDRRQRRGKVLRYYEDGESLDVEFNRADGQRVVGRYQLSAWLEAPRPAEEQLPLLEEVRQ